MASRFTTDEALAATEVAGRWETYFSPDDEEGLSRNRRFSARREAGTGTFLQKQELPFEVAEGDSLKLSCFDGDHAFLFLAEKDDAGILNGVFYSGTHWEEAWTGALNEDFELGPDELTF